MVSGNVKLALSIKNNPGSFALLIGSGVSTEAGIPTGRGVIEDLIVDISHAEGEEIETDPVEWYEEKYEQEPQYDDLMEKLGGTREERRSLLQGYFEPTSKEREKGEKLPTRAHQSIAWLVDQGFIDVIVTTNFDRLIETSLEQMGSPPLVISTDQDAQSPERIVHENSVLVKPNGDYKQVNLKNLNNELDHYSDNMAALLERIFSEYGLLVAGWSAKYDSALKEIVMSQDSVYSTFWANHGNLENDAREVIDKRDAIKIQIEGAENFFFELKENIQALEGAESSGSLTDPIARERVRSYISDDRPIDLAELFHEETERVYEEIFDEGSYPLDVEDIDIESFNQRLQNYQQDLSVLASASMELAFWSVESEKVDSGELTNVIERLGSPPSPETSPRKGDLVTLRERYPITYLTFLVGTVSIESGNWEAIQNILIDPEFDKLRDSKSALEVVHPWKLAGELRGLSQGNSYLRKHLKQSLYDELAVRIPSSKRYRANFELFEAILDLVLFSRFDERESNGVGIFSTSYEENVLNKINEQFTAQGMNWGPISHNLVSDNDVRPGLDLLRECMDPMEYIEIQA